MFKFDQLKTVHLEITSRCQASCPMCPRNYHSGQINPNLKIADWTYQDFIKIFDYETLLQLSSIYFCGNFGDPIMNDDLIPMCQYLKDTAPNIDIRIHTNGGARNSKWWKELRDSLPKNHVVIFALDGLEDTHHLYRVGTRYEVVIKNAKEFISYNGIAEWVFIKFKHNQHQVDEAEQRSKDLGFKRFTIKNTIRFIGEKKFSVLDKDGMIQYYLEPPDENQTILIDKDAIDNFNTWYKETEINCYVLETKEIYIDAHKNLFPCCFLASAPYNHPFVQPMITEIRKKIVSQYHELIKSIGGIEKLDTTSRSIKDIINDNSWQLVWNLYWNDKKLITCARTCGKTIFSKPNNQFIKRVINV